MIRQSWNIYITTTLWVLFFFTKVKNTDGVDTALVMLKLSLSPVIAGEFELGILKGIISIAY